MSIEPRHLREAYLIKVLETGIDGSKTVFHSLEASLLGLEFSGGTWLVDNSTFSAIASKKAA